MRRRGRHFDFGVGEFAGLGLRFGFIRLRLSVAFLQRFIISVLPANKIKTPLMISTE